MRVSGVLAAAIGLLVVAPIAPANAYTISPGELMYTDLFRWPNWREILAQYDGTPELTFYLWNAPSPQTPVIITPPPGFDPAAGASPGGADYPLDQIGAPGSDPPGAPPGDPVDPIGTPGAPGMPGGDTPGGGATTVPEPSTWAMLLLGFAGLGYAGFRRSKGPKVRDHCERKGRLSGKRFRTPS
jgi:hypothetical protein